MESLNELRKFIRENLEEFAQTFHSIERLKERVLERPVFVVGYEYAPAQYDLIGTYEVPSLIIEDIKRKFVQLEKYRAPKNKSLGIKIIEIPIIKNKIKFYPGYSFEEYKNKNLVLTDETGAEFSVGNVLYAVVRDNEITTVVFYKNYVNITPEKLKVDFIINNWKELDNRYLIKTQQPQLS